MDEYFELRKETIAKARFSFDSEVWFETSLYPNAFHRWMQKALLGIVWEKL